MTVAKVWDGAAWVPIVGAQGPAGPVGPQGPVGPPGAFLDVQRMYGANSAYKTITAGQQITTNAAGTIGLQLALTPSVNAWWEVSFHLGLVQKTDAAYHYMQPLLRINPNDVDSLGTIQDTLTQHSTVQTFEPHNITTIWKLAAGIAYIAYVTVGMSGGTWQYHQDPANLSIHGKAWAR